MHFKILPLFLFVVSMSFAQPNNDRIKTLKIAYITEHLDLTKNEAEKFWPIYNAFEDANDKLRKTSFENRKNIDIDNLSDTEATTLLNDIESSIAKKHELHSTFIKDLQAILPSKKILKLQHTERDFKRRMFREFRERRGRKH